MKNFQVVDSPATGLFDIFQLEDELFDLMFPNNQNIEYIDDLLSRLSSAEQKTIFPNVWNNEVEKEHVDEIQGTLFYGREYLTLKVQYPNNIEKSPDSLFNENKRCIQVVEDGIDIKLSTYLISEETFNIIFPNGQNMEYDVDAKERVNQAVFADIMSDIFTYPIDKKCIKGIDGTFFYGNDYATLIKDDYPNKKYNDP